MQKKRFAPRPNIPARSLSRPQNKRFVTPAKSLPRIGYGAGIHLPVYANGDARKRQ